MRVKMKESFYALLPKSHAVQDCHVGKTTEVDIHSLILIYPFFCCICPELPAALDQEESCALW